MQRFKNMDDLEKRFTLNLKTKEINSLKGLSIWEPSGKVQ